MSDRIRRLKRQLPREALAQTSYSPKFLSVAAPKSLTEYRNIRKRFNNDGNVAELICGSKSTALSARKVIVYYTA